MCPRCTPSKVPDGDHGSLGVRRAAAASARRLQHHLGLEPVALATGPTAISRASGRHHRDRSAARRLGDRRAGRRPPARLTARPSPVRRASSSVTSTRGRWPRTASGGSSASALTASSGDRLLHPERRRSPPAGARVRWAPVPSRSPEIPRQRPHVGPGAHRGPEVGARDSRTRPAPPRAPRCPPRPAPPASPRRARA